jgi:hypothetical protein
MKYFIESVATRFKSKFLSQDRNTLIDFLRGLSLIMVIFSHYGIYGYLLHSYTYVILGRHLSDVSAGMGYYGVVVFFVISGYLITSLTLKRYGLLPNINFSEFWWFRFSRIMPMLALCILTIIIFNVYGLPGLSGHSTNDLIKGISGILSFRFNEIISTTISGVWNPLWSLSVEEMFYFVFPFVCLFLTGRGAITWIFLTIFSTIIYFKYSDTLSPYSTLANVDYLALGSLTALAKPSRLREYLNPLGCKVWAYILVLCGLACIAAGFVISGPFETHFYTLLTALGAVLVLIASQLSSLSATKRYIFLPFTVIGLVSYEAYLIHMPLRDLLTLYGIHNSFYHIIIVILSAITVHFYFSEPLNLNLRNYKKFTNKGFKPLRKIIYHSLPFICLVILCPFFCDNLDPRSLTVKFVNIAQLPAQTVEPIAVYGHRGHGDMVFLKHIDKDHVQLGIDHWGGLPVSSKLFTSTEITECPITIRFGLHNIQVAQGDKLLLEYDQIPYGTSKSVAIGSNSEGFSYAVPKMITNIEIFR